MQSLRWIPKTLFLTPPSESDVYFGTFLRTTKSDDQPSPFEWDSAHKNYN